MRALLPDKFVPEEQTLLGQGALLLTLLASRPMSVAQLFVECRAHAPHVTYDAFVETLDVLYVLGAVDDRPPLVSLSS